MPARLQCEFSLIRYVPDVVKGEFTNIGVLLRESNSAHTQVKFTRDWSRVRCMDPAADTDLLESLEADIADRLSRAEDHATLDQHNARPILATLEDSLSNSVQLSETRGTLAESLPAELEQLMRLYVEPLKLQTLRRKQTGRAAIVAAMRDEFERTGVWRLMRKRIAAAQYTQQGDPLKLDCGYRNGVVKMFQAVSLDSDVETAKVLAYSATALRAGVERQEGAPLELTAIVEPIATVSDEAEYTFALDILQREQIRVLTTADLARVAATARRELHV